MIESKQPDNGAPSEAEPHAGSIAIVGMAARFPDAPDLATYWGNLKTGHESIRDIPLSELEDDHDASVRNSPGYVRRRPILDGIENFDAAFFGMSPREAALTDPQQRVFLECAWSALEDAGLDPETANGPIGIFAGGALNTYFLRHVCGDRAKIREFTSEFQVGHYQELLGAMQDFVASRVAYKLNLKGPAVTVQSACSTSLLAVAQACQSLQLYQCDAALAGGVSISVPQRRGYESLDGGMVSADGHVRPFDAGANGTVFGSGCGVVVLKRLEDAVAAGDHIYAVIRGAGVNNDGADKVGFTAPSVAGQAEVIRLAHANAGVRSDQISYVEAHGTATPLGDPIEFRALEEAFGRGDEHAQTCMLGSVKANVGHLDAAAGVAGLIKVALQLHHEEVLPQINFAHANPAMDLARGRFRVTTTSEAWPRRAAQRMAGVSAFGVGGTNVHLVLEEAPPRAPVSVPSDIPVVLPLSAKTGEAMRLSAARLAQMLEQRDAPSLVDVAETLARGRRVFSHRAAIAVRDPGEAVRQLTRIAESPSSSQATATRNVVCMFPGQGAQYPGMAAGLFAGEPVFADWINRGAHLAGVLLGRDLKQLLFDEVSGDEQAPHALRDTTLAQPALYIMEYALAQLWISRGVIPSALIGHSLGEFVAAALAGIFSFEDGLRLVIARGRIMQALPPGGMLAVRATLPEVKQLLTDGVEIAAVNAPNLVTVAGTGSALDAFQLRAEAQDMATRRLHTSHAFHSAMMEPAIAEMLKLFEGVALAAPKIPIASCVTGTWMTAADATSPQYWARHCRLPVLFAEAAQTVVADTTSVLLEVGPGRTLSTFARQALPRDRHAQLVSSLPEFADRADDSVTDKAAIAQLWTLGVGVALPSVAGARRVSLPTYSFAPTRHWIELADGPEAAMPVAPAAATDTTQSKSVSQGDVTSERSMTDQKTSLHGQITRILEELSGETIDAVAASRSFLELGFDSLMLGQVAQRVQKLTGVKVAFRQLLGDLPTIDALATHLAVLVPATPIVISAPVPAGRAAEVPTASAPVAQHAGAATSGLDGLIREQLATLERVMAQQLDAVKGVAARSPVQSDVKLPVRAIVPVAPAKPRPVDDVVGGERFRMFEQRPRTAGGGTALSPAQKDLIAEIIARSDARMPASKADTQVNRRVQADPRSASGFRAEWKEVVYPLVVDRSQGSKLWDMDGNEYVDLVNGFGQTMFGHAPDFVTEAIKAQVEKGFAIGPQTPLAGEVAVALAKMLRHERIAFCNTGSEAVMAAMRVARAVTGRSKVAFFGGDYHGQFDEVLAKGLSRRAAVPGAQPAVSGIPPEAVANMVVLPYDAPESLTYIRDHAEELAAVLVEPVQSRHPGLFPKAFLHQLRAITAETGTALIFDEVVTGFRVHPAGVQGLLGITADMATYGKVLGGGMPIGILAGSGTFLDALDGGHWTFGNASVPEVAPTFFAGTFVRHPLTLAAAKAVLAHMTTHGPQLQERLSAATAGLVARLNSSLERRGVRSCIEVFASFFYFNLAAEDALASLLYPLMRLEGVHIAEGFPCFLTTAHSEADLDCIVAAFEMALDALQSAGILASSNAVVTPTKLIDAPVPSPPDLGRFAPTEAQREIYLAAQFGDAASCAFNESVRVNIDGPVDADALAAALRDVVERHDALRASFGATGEWVTVDPSAKVILSLSDLSAERDPKLALEWLLAGDAKSPFDLAHGPLLRARLVSLADTSRVLILTAHHIICDGWSMSTLISEVLEFYRVRTTGVAGEFAPVLFFRDFARSEATESEAGDPTRKFWADMYRDIPAVAELPTDRPRPAQRTWAGATVTESLDADLTRAVKAAAKQQGATLFSVLFSSLQVLLGRLSGAPDVVLTVPMAAQTKLDGQSLIGHCVNFLPVRKAFDFERSFAEHVKAVQVTMQSVLAHQDYTLGTLVRDLKIARSIERTPLSDVQFNLERLGDDLSMPGASVSVAPNPKAAVNFDLFFNFIDGRDGLRLDVDYNTDLYDALTVRRWIGHLRTLLRSIAYEPHCAIGRLSIISADEARWMIDDLNQTQRAFDRNATVHGLIEAQVRRTPNAVAVCCGGRVMSYAELDRAADELARVVVRAAPVAGARIAVAVHRSIDMLVALLAVLKAGHAYVPLDPTHPEARLRQTLDAARVSALIATGAEVVRWAGENVPVISFDERHQWAALAPSEVPTATGSAARAAYVIFTSGSTGTPKGVEVGHRSVVNFLQSMAATPGFTARDHLLAVTTVCFDIAGLELFLPLVTGGSLTIASREDVQDGFALVALLESSGATVMQATPSLWQIMLEAGFRPRKGIQMLCGGEPLPRDLANQLTIGDAELWNLYGPTETTIWSSCGRVDRGAITIGEPIANTQMFVLDARDQLVPIGVPGDLFIGGDGLAHGYFERADLTATAFRDVEIAAGRRLRLYRTGDVARRMPDGTLQLFGRRDQQIKLRGYRIELEEIEANLRAAADVASAAVAVRDDGGLGPRLVAFIVAKPGTAWSSKALAMHASAGLPDYMVPSLWVRVENLPMTGNGKLDRKALLTLPLPSTVRPEQSAQLSPAIISDAASMTETEERIAAVWREVMGLPVVSRDVAILDLGADSLHIFRIAARLHAKGIPVQARDLLSNPTIAKQGELADRALAMQGRGTEVPQAPHRDMPRMSDYRSGAMRNRQAAR